MGRRTGLKSQENFLDYARYGFSNLMNNSLVFLFSLCRGGEAQCFDDITS